MSDLANHRSGIAEVNGAHLYYEVAGEGHPLVLLHAGIADSRMWDDQFTEFARRYRVLRFDFRGFGKSGIPPQAYSMRGDLYELLRQLDIQRAHLIGVSMGGGIAIDVALERPELVSALIPVGPGVSGMSEATPEEIAYFEQVEAAIAAGDIERANEMETHVWVDGLHRTREQGPANVRERIYAMNAISFANLAASEQAKTLPLDPPAVGRLGTITAPTLAIVGDADMSGIQHAVDLIVASVPNARKVVMHDTAHVPNMEQPKEFNAHVLVFLDTLG
ncbi:MAG: alpha/beta fold hydrolase [Ktedonobacterales bacterium]